MKKLKKIFIIAGEVSGDVLGAEIMRAAPSVKFVGVGGARMRAAGLRSLFPISDLSVMGFAEVVARARTLARRIRETAGAIVREQPDIVLTIDSSGFAARVIGRVKRLSADLPLFYHVVAPMVWAWGAGRARKYARVWDRLFCFFDFERPYFEKYGLRTTAIGYPPAAIAKAPKRARKTGGAPSLVALLPGSRMGEAARLMPVYKEFAETHPQYDYAVPVAETTKDFVSREIKSWAANVRAVPFARRYELYARALFSVAASGTAAAELAIMRLPAVVVYRAKWLTHFLAKMVLRTKYVSLINILTGKEIFPELIGRNVTAKNIDSAINDMDMKRVAVELKSADHLWRVKKSPMSIVAGALMK